MLKRLEGCIERLAQWWEDRAVVRDRDILMDPDPKRGYRRWMFRHPFSSRMDFIFERDVEMQRQGHPPDPRLDHI